MNGARSTILARLREASKTARLSIPSVPEQVHEVPPPTPEATLQRFVDEAQAVGVDVFVESTAVAVRTRLAELAGDRAVLSWDLAVLPYDAGTTLTRVTLGDMPRDAWAVAEIGVTGCAAALADTGTLVLVTGPGRPRAASLLPLTHIALVRRADIVPGLTEYLRAHANDVGAAACCSFITGPSRTADIELTLTRGVHGPGKVVAIVGP